MTFLLPFDIHLEIFEQDALLALSRLRGHTHRATGYSTNSLTGLEPSVAPGLWATGNLRDVVTVLR